MLLCALASFVAQMAEGMLEGVERLLRREERRMSKENLVWVAAAGLGNLGESIGLCFHLHLLRAALLSCCRWHWRNALLVLQAGPHVDPLPVGNP